MTSARYGPHGVGSLQPTSQADSLIYSTCQLLKGLMSIGIGVGTGGGGARAGTLTFLEKEILLVPHFSGVVNSTF